MEPFGHHIFICEDNIGVLFPLISYGFDCFFVFFSCFKVTVRSLLAHRFLGQNVCFLGSSVCFLLYNTEPSASPFTHCLLIRTKINSEPDILTTYITWLLYWDSKLLRNNYKNVTALYKHTLSIGVVPEKSFI